MKYISKGLGLKKITLGSRLDINWCLFCFLKYVYIYMYIYIYIYIGSGSSAQNDIHPTGKNMSIDVHKIS